jgi:hypothetical protein
MSQVACALAEIAGMQAENTQSIMSGGNIKHGRKDFENITHGILGHNSVISFFSS